MSPLGQRLAWLLIATSWIIPGATAVGDAAGNTQYLWQTNSSGNDVHIIDVAARTVVKRLVVGPEPHGIAAPADGHVVYVSLEANARGSGELVWVDPRTHGITHRMTMCREPHAIATTPDGRWVYVPCRDGHYWVIDARNKQVVKKIKTGGRPHNTQASRDGRYVYLSPMGDSARVMIVDVEAGHQVVGEIPFSAPLRPAALSADNARFYQHIDGLNGFQVADVPARKVIATVKHKAPLGWLLPSKKLGWLDLDGFHRCHGLAIRPDQQEIWSGCGRRVNVHSLTQEDFPESDSIPMLDGVYWLAFTPDSRYGFVAIPDEDKVAMVDARTKQVIVYFEVGRAPKRNLVITPGHRAGPQGR